MAAIRLFFLQNEPIIQFAYGLAFFVAGLAIALQSRSSSRLELARSLAWLAAFAVTHSLYVWGELFAPVQEAYLNEGGAEILHSFHLSMLSISFACLFEFGVSLLRPLGQGQWLRWVALGWFVAYTVLTLAILPGRIADPHVWHNVSDALARYTIGLPGGLLAAYGLRAQTFRHIAPLEAPNIVSNLRLTGISLALFAIIAGLVTPPIPFFPGSVVNTSTFVALVGFPPLVIISVLGLLFAITVIRALEVFQVETERRIEQMEQQQILAAERERIGRELHDGTVQTAYTAGLLVDSARKLAEPGSPIAYRLDKAVDVLGEVIADLRRNLGELHGLASDETLAAALQKMTADPRFRSLVEIELELDLPTGARLPPREMGHFLAIVHEAMANVVRHSRARRVEITLQHTGRQLCLAIQDDGSGLPGQPKEGYGLRNMHERARMLGGTLSVAGRSGRGTRVEMTVPDERLILPVEE